MRIEEVLESEHRKVEQQLENIIRSNNKNQQQKIFSDVAKEILGHIEAEEEIYYSAIRELLDDESDVEESIQEHALARSLLDEIDVTDPTSDEWLAKIEVLKENLEHHHEEEEDEFFSVSREKILQTKAEAMGTDFIEKKELLLERPTELLTGEIERPSSSAQY